MHLEPTQNDIVSTSEVVKSLTIACLYGSWWREYL